MSYYRVAPLTDPTDQEIPGVSWYDQWTKDDECEARQATKARLSNLSRCDCERCSPAKRVKHEKFHPSVAPYLNTRNSSYYQNMQYNQYELVSLAQFIADTFSKPKHEWTNFQRKAQEQWQLRSKTLLQQLASDYNASNGFQALKECFSIINRLCFLGQLRKVKLRWIPNLYDENTSLLGCCSIDPSDHTLDICINPEHSKPKGVNIFGTLLHEATHAFLEQYGCTGSRSAACKCRNLQIVKVGRWGHGPAWRSLVAAVQDFAVSVMGVGSHSSDFLGLVNSTAIDVKKGDPHPSMCELEKTFKGLSICPGKRKAL